MISGVIGFITSFLLHKYVVFEKKSAVAAHFFKFCVLGIFNLGAVALILYALVEFVGMPAEIAKIIANGSVVLWNFFIMKLIVYV